MDQNTLPKIIDCEARNCLYNFDGNCSTYAITVGDEEPCCDTFLPKKEKGGISGVTGFVGACHTSSCEYNNLFECTAPGIHVTVKSGHPDCGTYTMR